MATQEKEKLAQVNVTVAENQEAVVLNADTLPIVGACFTIQDEYDNESKFQRRFFHEAVSAYAKQFCARSVATWERTVDKASKLHATWTREQVVQDLLSSKRNKKLHDVAQQAITLRKTL